MTFSEPVNPSTLAAGAVTLTDNGNAVALSGLSLTLISGDTYAINGLSGFTTAEGTYG